MMEGDNRLADIAQQIRDKRTVEPITVRQFLLWFGAQLRGSWTVQLIRTSLRKAGLQTEPDFESAYVDSPISFSLISGVSAPEAVQTKSSEISESVAVSDSAIAVITTERIYADPTYRISKLATANNKPISVAPDASLQVAVTLMLNNDFSQLPVMSNERDVRGIITWTSMQISDCGMKCAVSEVGMSDMTEANIYYVEFLHAIMGRTR
jgi:hypothetical protein